MINPLKYFFSIEGHEIALDKIQVPGDDPLLVRLIP